MDKRQQELKNLKEFNNNIQKEVTLLLQNLQWDPKLITEKCRMVACKCDSNHRILPETRDAHEQQCQLIKLGYRKEDSFLPDPVHPNATTLVKFSKHEITEIINYAANNDPSFKRGVGSEGPEPLTVERLQLVYTADERRAIHDAVVSTAPFCHDLTDLDLLSSNNGTKESQKKSRLEILAELRNMKRRRAKYRVAPKTRNYSDVLRDVIKTQMDSYGEATRTIIKTEYGPNCHVSQNVTNSTFEHVPHDTIVKQEQESPEIHNRFQRQEPRESYRGRSKERRRNDERHAIRKDDYSNKERSKTYRARNESSKDSNAERDRERRSGDDGRWHHKERYSSKDRSNYRESHYGRSRERRYIDDRHLDYSPTDSSKKYERVIKQERASPKSEIYASSSKDHNRDHSRINEDSSENEYSGKERNHKHRKRHNPDKFNERERESSPSDSYRVKETSRKRHRSRSKEKRHKDKKKRHDKDKYSSKRDKEHDSKRGHDYLYNTIIKQERESP